MNDKIKVAPNIEPQKGLSFQGIWTIQLFNAETGGKEFEQTQKNIVVDIAATTMCSGAGPASFTVLHLGNAPVSSLFPPSTGDTQLQQDINLVGYPTIHTPLISVGNFSFEKKATLVTTDAVGIITESGLFNPAGVMFNHVLFNPPIVKINGQDQVAYLSSLIDEPVDMNNGNDSQTPIEKVFL